MEGHRSVFKVGAKMEKQFLKTYFQEFEKAVTPSEIVLDQIIQTKKILMEMSHLGKKAVVLGNGGSAAMASHMAVDLTKNASTRSVNFNEADLLTCFSNDYGYELAYAQAIKFYGDEGDVLIAISSSGTSENILKAVNAARKANFGSIITFSGMDEGNPLSSMGDINFWVNSHAYNIIENTHQVWMLSVVDLIIGKSEYST